MTSCGALPVFVLACSISRGSKRRLQLAMSTVPLDSAAIPVPDPPPETSTETAGSTVAYSSAQACARLTMVSEPVSWITVFRGPLSREQPAARSARASKPAVKALHACRLNAGRMGLRLKVT